MTRGFEVEGRGIGVETSSSMKGLALRVRAEQDAAKYLQNWKNGVTNDNSRWCLYVKYFMQKYLPRNCIVRVRKPTNFR